MTDENQTFFSLGSEFNDTNLPSRSNLSNITGLSSLDNNDDTITGNDLENLEEENEEAISSGDENSTDEPSNAELLQSLQVMLNNEKLAPDLLPCYPEKIDAICEIIKEQREKVKAMSKSANQSNQMNLKNLPGLASSSTGNASHNLTINSTLR